MNSDNPQTNDNIMQTVRSQRRVGRALVFLASALGLLSIIASIAIAWANIELIMPMERLLVEDYPRSVQDSGKNAEGKTPLSREELDWRQVQVTGAHGKAAIMSSLSITLQAAGTLVILALVIFNRRVTLRQVNSSLLQISQQIEALRRERGRGEG